MISCHPSVSVNPKSCFLEETRSWHVEFNNKKLIIPCGGTHLLDKIVSHFSCEIIVDPENSQYFSVKTRVHYVL